MWSLFRFLKDMRLCCHTVLCCSFVLCNTFPCLSIRSMLHMLILANTVALAVLIRSNFPLWSTFILHCFSFKLYIVYSYKYWCRIQSEFFSLKNVVFHWKHIFAVLFNSYFTGLQQYFLKLWFQFLGQFTQL